MEECWQSQLNPFQSDLPNSLVVRNNFVLHPALAPLSPAVLEPSRSPAYTETLDAGQRGRVSSIGPKQYAVVRGTWSLQVGLQSG